MSLSKEPFSLYIHIPYCVSKCPYCDFNVHVVAKIPEREYTQMLIRELDFYAQSEDWCGRSLRSIFFGGGTPSAFQPASIAEILEKAAALFPLEREIEISLEANPSSEDAKHFSGYRSCGVNRISIGAQSFQPHLLQFLGRLHSAYETRAALRILRQAGFKNFNVDLIYAIPGQTLSDLRADVEEALSFDPPHLSAYNLSLEQGTPFHRDYLAGRIRPLSEETEISMAELIGETLSRTGLMRYEISNYARERFYSRHNVNYWKGGDYLGIGAGAHSYKNEGCLGYRWHNEKNPGRYMASTGHEGHAVKEREKVDVRQTAAEFMFLGVRMVQGILLAGFAQRFGQRADEFYPEINDWLEEGLMEQEEGRLRFTRRGLLVADSIFLRFI
jgi:oxygen-independent coproporphyrinogen-3 oxidase